MPWQGFSQLFQNAFGLVLLLVLATFVVVSLTPYHGWTGVLITALGTLTATVALATVRARRTLVVRAAGLSAVAVAFAVVGAAASSHKLFAVTAVIMVGMLAVAGLAVLRAVVTEQRVGFRTILGAVSVYIILGLLFAFVYVATDRIQGQPFFGSATQLQTGDTVFFSMTTLTTTGYGDLVPASQPGKMFATLEMFIGQIFLVTLISRLVSMWQPGAFFEAPRLKRRRQSE